MRTTILLLSACCIASIGCKISIHGWPLTSVAGSGNVVTQQRHVTDFTRVNYGGSGRIKVSHGDTLAIAVTCDDNLMEYIETNTDGGTLSITTTKPISPTDDVFVEITCPGLSAFHFSGSGLGELDDIQGSLLDIQMSGSGRISGTGAVDELTADLSGSGSILVERIEAASAVVSVSGSGRVQVRASDKFKGNISGSGSIKCFGAPAAKRQSISGSGSIRVVD